MRNYFRLFPKILYHPREQIALISSRPLCLCGCWIDRKDARNAKDMKEHFHAVCSIETIALACVAQIETCSRTGNPCPAFAILGLAILGKPCIILPVTMVQSVVAGLI